MAETANISVLYPKEEPERGNGLDDGVDLLVHGKIAVRSALLARLRSSLGAKGEVNLLLLEIQAEKNLG